MKDKIVLDPCCGSRMMWYDKNNPIALFSDQRNEQHTLCDGRMLYISPDVVMDARNLQHEDCSFWHIVLDPPHLNKLGVNSWMAKKYGKLLPSWETDIKGMFDEAMRVLKVNGTLNFKWNETQIPEKKLIEVLGITPLYGTRMGKGNKTIWMAFIKQ